MKEPYYITASKKMCLEAGMNPNEPSRPRIILSEAAFKEKRETYSEILSVVRFFSDKLLDSLKGTPILVAVSDAEGYLLDIEGDASSKEIIEQFGIKSGSLFIQEDTGTNVISLALHQQHPISLIGDQHFHKYLHEIACYGTAFYIRDENKLLGSVSIMMPIQFQNPLYLSMLSQSVDSIERELLLRKQNSQLDILNQIMLSRTSNGIVITDEKGITTEFNHFAQKISGIERNLVVGRNIRESHLTGAYFKEVLEQGKVFTNEELKFEDKFGNLVVCLFDAQPIFEGNKMIGAFGQFRDISERYLLQEQYNYLAFHDDLTKLPNRRYVKKEIEDIIEEIHAGRDRTLGLIYIDLDRFKVINDNFNHSYGDSLLDEVSKRLSNVLGENEVLARMGGDEFIFLLVDFDEPDYVTKKAEAILDLFEQPFSVKNKEIHTTASIGIAIYPDYTLSYEELMVYADNAMYQAKLQGKNRYVVHTSKLLEGMQDEYSLEIDLRKALENNEFLLHYQPQVHNLTGEWVGFEALIRWQHPVHGLLYPGKFIKAAEENGLITQIGEWVINEAITQNKAWQQAGMQPMKMSVNLSTQQFLTTNLITYVEEVLQRTGLDPQCFVVEITEYMAMEYDYSIRVLNQLKALGIGISIDDFGTGYSSLNYLKNFPIDSIKIDKSFVDELMNDQNDAYIVKAIITLAHNLQLEVIAEGVETIEQLNFLQEHECDVIQGFYFSKPLPPEEIEKKYFK